METNSNTVHIFQAAGLGVGPFKLHHVSGEGGKCQYCATPILWRFYLNGIDGSTFFVGSDCVMKTGDAGLMKTQKSSAEWQKPERSVRMPSWQQSRKA
jgi:hypothetical protein